MRFFCRIGCHVFDKREIHVEEVVESDKETFLSSIIERCQCGAHRIATGGETMPTTIHVPSGYWDS